ncbi:MAG: hypothetical protein B7Z80_06380 [Rhodospirillales bacterium 20-64-7]|nr:MAG: hypothetical protein B7Z80_06380 [Rhodospirillales bacterium 20-64-7]
MTESDFMVMIPNDACRVAVSINRFNFTERLTHLLEVRRVLACINQIIQTNELMFAKQGSGTDIGQVQCLFHAQPNTPCLSVAVDGFT